jgi:hypothetical protein
MSSEFNLWSLDDSSIGGDVSSVLRYLEIVKHVGTVHLPVAD